MEVRHPCSEFETWKLSLTTDLGPVRVPGRGSARILLVVSGSCTAESEGHTLTLHQGESAFLSGHEHDVLVSGAAEVFGASSGLR